nr:helix-turn-helix domain-containing protein [uncultured Undibacterium sp.]
MTNHEPRGVLRPSFSEGQFQHLRLAPSAALVQFVAHYWFVSWDLRGCQAQQQATLPHPNVHLIVEQGKALIYGVHSERFTRELAEQDRVFGIKFKAGGFYPFHRKPIADVHNQTLDISVCFAAGDQDLVAGIEAARDFPAMCDVAENFLLAYLPDADPKLNFLDQLLKDIEQDRSLISVDDLITHTGLDKRSLQRLFQVYVGASPKWVIQRYRLHQAIAEVQAGKTCSWSDLALELGYFDQAHFGRDFRALIGMTPGEYERSLQSTS